MEQESHYLPNDTSGPLCTKAALARRFVQKPLSREETREEGTDLVFFGQAAVGMSACESAGSLIRAERD